jgi:cell division protein FtsX
MMADNENMTLESLNLKKPLEKMTAKELRELCIEKIPQITGASGMSKEELLHNIKDFFGLLDDEHKGSMYKDQILSIKRQIKDLKAQKQELPSSSNKEKERLRKRIKQLKRQTRRLAAQ